MLGYWNRPAETSEILRDGWLRTGDICRMDASGWFYVVDRLKEMIDASGFKVVPREVEKVLLMHPAVGEAVVAGVPDAYRGETVKAFVVLRAGQEASDDEITSFCRLHLAAFKSRGAWSSARSFLTFVLALAALPAAAQAPYKLPPREVVV